MRKVPENNSLEKEIRKLLELCKKDEKDNGEKRNYFNAPITEEEMINWEERKQILEAIRYVDQVVEVTDENHEKMKAWNLYHFDCLFSGDDYSGNPYWIEDQKSLQRVGSNIEFFPYTKSTSSTMIKAAITKSLEQK